VWEGSVAPDPGLFTEEEADNEIVIVFRTTYGPDVDSVENQAEAQWDENGDEVINSLDTNVANATPAVSDDLGTSEESDPTVFLIRTGQIILYRFIIGVFLIIISVSVFILFRKRKKKVVDNQGDDALDKNNVDK
jgi:hypothetical protein